MVFRHESPRRRGQNSGLIHSVVVTSAHVHDLTPAADLLHGDEQFVYGDAGYQRRLESKGAKAEFRVAMRPGKRRALPDPPEGKLQDLIVRLPKLTSDQESSIRFG